MTKSELVTSVSALADMPCEAAHKAVSAVFTAIMTKLILRLDSNHDSR